MPGPALATVHPHAATFPGFHTQHDCDSRASDVDRLLTRVPEAEHEAHAGAFATNSHRLAGQHRHHRRLREHSTAADARSPIRLLDAVRRGPQSGAVPNPEPAAAAAAADGVDASLRPRGNVKKGKRRIFSRDRATRTPVDSEQAGVGARRSASGAADS